MLIKLIKNSKGSILLEFSICGTLFIAIILGITMIGLWIYNTAQVSQAARLAAYKMSITNNQAFAKEEALNYMDKTLVACNSLTVDLGNSEQVSYSRVKALMDPIFPGIHKLLIPQQGSYVEGSIRIEKEAISVREERFR
ncbi:MAG: pilus assembly protein [Peptococcaceae bacterium]|nr:pilus assembly protein [Peptococcaceae bacterium]